MTRITEPLILPPDVDLTPVASLSPELRRSIGGTGTEWAVTRPRSRTPSRVVDADLADLLLLFRDGSTVADAIARFALTRGVEASDVLTQALPALDAFVASMWLVPVTEPRSAPIGQTLEIGAEVSGLEVIDCRSLIEDSELYQVRDPAGRHAALKLLPHGTRSQALVSREARALRKVGGPPAPSVIGEGTYNGRPYLVTEWCEGISCSVHATDLRDRASASGSRALLDLCIAIAFAYVEIHERGVLHGDVHPGNVLVMPDGSIRILDFGLAVMADSGESARGGVVYYFDPEHARAELDRRRPDPLTTTAEQYSIAALLYFLLTGRHHYDFSAERLVSLAQIAEEDAIDVRRHGAELPIANVLMRALSRAPEQRYTSTRSFTNALDLASRNLSEFTPRPHIHPSLDADDYVAGRLDWLRAAGPAAMEGAPGPHGSIMFGTAGVAYGMLRIAGARGDPDLLGEAMDWTDAALAGLDQQDSFADDRLELGPQSVGEISPFHTESGVHLVEALVGQANGDVTAVRSGVEGFLRAVDHPSTELDLTIGRTSITLGCAQLLQVCARLPNELSLPDAEARVRALGSSVIADVWSKLGGDHPGHSETAIDFLGIAHGWAGLAYADLLWSAATRTPPSGSALDVLERLAGLAERSDRRARWPITTRSRGRHHNYMTSWCNGAPGFVFLWDTAYEVLGDSRFLDLAEASALETWTARDQIGSLCCGYSGRAYALLRHARSTGTPVWLHRARILADFARRSPSSGLSHSLFKGEWGTAVLSAELNTPDTARFPLVELDADRS